MAQTLKYKNLILILHFAEWEKMARKGLEQRLLVASEFFKNEMQKNLSTSGKNNPSFPGEFPHTRSGQLRRSIFVELDRRNLQARIGPTVKKGLWLEEGISGGALIRPVRHHILTWIDPATGRRVFARSVVQGKIEPRPFIQKTVAESAEKMKALLEAAFPDGIFGSLEIR